MITKAHLKKWLYATRPHTLVASIAPMLVVLGALISEDTFDFCRFLLAFLVAIFAQVTTNIANDYFDFTTGKDTLERQGFTRMLTSGEITPREMLVMMFIAIAITALLGLVLVLLQGWHLLIIGAVVLIAAVAYSAGPFPLSYHALGDVSVVLFYGVIPIMVGYYAITGDLPQIYLLPLSLGMGFWSTNILVCNNYRDFDEDSVTGKRTIVVRMGKTSGPLLYKINSFLALISIVLGLFLQGSWIFAIIVGIVCGLLYRRGVSNISKGGNGEAMNQLLVYTGKVNLISSILLLFALIF